MSPSASSNVELPRSVDTDIEPDTYSSNFLDGIYQFFFLKC